MPVKLKGAFLFHNFYFYNYQAEVCFITISSQNCFLERNWETLSIFNNKSCILADFDSWTSVLFSHVLQFKSGDIRVLASTSFHLVRKEWSSEIRLHGFKMLQVYIHKLSSFFFSHVQGALWINCWCYKIFWWWNTIIYLTMFWFQQMGLSIF